MESNDSGAAALSARSLQKLVGTINKDGRHSIYFVTNYYLDDDEVDDSEEWDNPDLESQGTYSSSNLAYDFMYMREIGNCQYYITKLDDDRFLMSNCDEMNEFPTKGDAVQAYLSGR